MAQQSLLGNFLDKLNLVDTSKQQKIQSNQIATDFNDGAVEMDDAFSQYLLSVDWSYNSQAELLDTYREVANYGIVDYAIEDVVNEMVSFNETETPVELDLSNLDEDLSDNIKKLVYESFDKISNILDINNTIHKRARQFYIDGRLAYQKVIDPSNTKQGLMDVIELDSKFVTKVRNKKYNNQTKTIESIQEYFVYDENVSTNKGNINKNQRFSQNQQFKEALRLDPNMLTYVTSGLTDMDTGMAISWLHKAVKPANQLRMMENALVIYRITRAPERRIFYVDVSNLPKTKAEQYIRRLKNMHQNNMSFDPESGTFQDRKHLQTMQENYWLPRNSDGRGTQVDTLPGGCLAMDTKVSLLDGRELSIEAIKNEMDEGKELWAYSCNPKTGEVVPGLISWAGVTQNSAQVMKLTLDNGEEIICTPDHKFPVYGKGFLRADELNENESMMSMNYAISISNIEYLDDPIEVGTLTIDQDETYHDFHTFALSVGIFTKNSNLGDIEDVTYFQKQLYKSLNIPITRLESENAILGWQAGQISRDELKFSKFVSKIRKRFNIMFLDLLKTELILTKIMTIQEWDEIKHKIDFIYAQDMQLEEMRNADIERDRLDLMNSYEPFVGVYVSHRFIRENVLKQSEQDRKTMDEEIQEEKKNPQYQQQQDQDSQQNFQ